MHGRGGVGGVGRALRQRERERKKRKTRRRRGCIREEELFYSCQMKILKPDPGGRLMTGKQQSRGCAGGGKGGACVAKQIRD